MKFGYQTGGLDNNERERIPEDKLSTTMWHTFISVTDDSELWFDMDLDVVHRNRGSGVYQYLAVQNNRVVYGVVSKQWMRPGFQNTRKTRSNRATRINKERFKQSCRWGLC
jgi:hypothetical protein